MPVTLRFECDICGRLDPFAKSELPRRALGDRIEDLRPHGWGFLLGGTHLEMICPECFGIECPGQERPE